MGPVYPQVGPGPGPFGHQEGPGGLVGPKLIMWGPTLDHGGGGSIDKMYDLINTLFISWFCPVVKSAKGHCSFMSF